MINRRFGAKSALDYLIGEKLTTFADAARDDPAFAEELPRFCLGAETGQTMRIQNTLAVLCGILVFSVTALHAARLTLYIDGDNRTPYDASRGKAGRADWTAAVNTRKGTVLTDNFNGVNIDVPEGKATSVGNFSIFFTQTGGISKDAGNTAKLKHPTGIFVGTTGTGSTAGKNDEQIEGIELRYEIGDQKTTALEFRFNPPIFAFAADVYSVDGKSYAPYRQERGDLTTLHVLEHAIELTQIFAYSSSGYDSFLGIVSDKPFDKISFTAAGRSDRWRLDNVSIAR